MTSLGRILVAGAVVWALTSGGASAHQQTVLDTDDTAGGLDLVAARHDDPRFSIVSSHPERSTTFRELQLRATTFEAWDPESLSGVHNFIAFEFDLDGDPQVERCLVITGEEVDPGEYRLRADAYKGCIYFNDERIGGSTRIRRPDDHTVKVFIRKKRLLGSDRLYRWRAATAYEQPTGSSECPAPEPHGDGGYGACSDFTEWQRHRTS